MFYGAILTLIGPMGGTLCGLKDYANSGVWEWCSAQAIADSGKARANAGWGQTIKYKMIEIKFEQNKQKTT